MRARVLIVAVVAAVAIGLIAAPAGAKAKNPCKVLKASEIKRVLDGTVGRPTKGLATPVSIQCKWSVDANAQRPKGDVIVHYMFKGGAAAYAGLKGTPGYEPAAGLANALYSERTSSLGVLKGGVYLTVQGVFIDSSSLPIHQVDVEAQLVELMKSASKRV